jgi:serine/threonine-protein kinase
MVATSHARSLPSATDPLLAELIDEVSRQLEDGEPVDLDAFIAAHPERAEALRLVLPALAVLADLGRSASGDRRSDPEVADSLHSSLGELGDYRIVREVGRGGMGVVYEAMQISLGRRVALKVLPFAGALDSQHLARFRLEAQAAAQLHHTNIVPVFAVGCERGVHYYAMQFIEGRTLAALIRELRDEDPPTESIIPSPLEGEGGRRPDEGDAACGSAAALVPPHPGPLPDGERATAGEPGIAPDAEPQQCSPSPLAGEGGPQGRCLSSSPSPRRGEGSPQGRMRGDLPRGSAKAPSYSTRTRAYFRTVADLGRQAAVALEHAHCYGILHRDVKPANLILDDRGNLWVTDFGLARIGDDAGLTMTGDLLGTLRYMSPEQALGHPAVIDQRSDVYSLGATLYELLTLRPAVPGRDRQEVLRRIANEDPKPPRRINPAIPRELETIVLKALAKEPASRYAAVQELADDLRRFTENRPITARRPTVWDRAVKWVRRHTVFFIVAMVFLALGSLVLGTATTIVWHEKSRAQRAYSAEVKLRRSARKAVDEMYRQVAEQLLTQKPDLEKVRREFLEKAVSYYQEFALEDNALPSERYEVATDYRRIAEIQRRLGNRPEAEYAYTKAIEIIDGLMMHHPRDPGLANELIFLRSNLAFVLSDSGRLGEAEREFRTELSIAEKLASDFPDEPKYQRKVAWVCGGLATVLFKLHRYPEGGDLCRREQEILEGLSKSYPSETVYQASLAISHNNLGVVWCETGRFDRAVASFERALDLNKRLADLQPENPSYRDDLFKNYTNLGETYFQLGDLQRAEDHLLQAISVLKKSQEEFPNLFTFRNSFDHLSVLGNVMRAQGEIQKAEPYLREAVGIGERVLADHPRTIDHLPMIADSHIGLAKVLWEGRKIEEARSHYQRAQAIWEQMKNLSPNSPMWRTDLAQHLVGCLELPLRDPAKAVALAREAIDNEPDDAAAWSAIGVALYRQGEAKEALKALNQAMEKSSGGSATTWYFLAMAHAKLGDGDTARSWFEKAETWRQGKTPRDPELRHLRDETTALPGFPSEPRSNDRRRSDSKSSG